MQRLIIYFLLFFSINLAFSQDEKKDENEENNSELIVTNRNNQSDFELNPLAPAKAAFYSAILPGLGQAYNKKYWIIPVIYGSMGASMYGYSFYNKKHNQFLEAYKLDLAGKPHEFENLDRSALERGINNYKRQRDLYLFVTIGVYILNVVEANVDAHLPNKKIDERLSYQPSFIIDSVTNNMNFGATVTFSF